MTNKAESSVNIKRPAEIWARGKKLLSNKRLAAFWIAILARDVDSSDCKCQQLDGCHIQGSVLNIDDSFRR